MALSYIDPSGVTVLKLLNEDFNKMDITIYIAGISGIVLKGHNLLRLNVLVTNVCIKSQHFAIKVKQNQNLRYSVSQHIKKLPHHQHINQCIFCYKWELQHVTLFD